VGGLEFCCKRFEVTAGDGGVMQVPESFAGGDCFDCLAQTFRARSVRISIGFACFLAQPAQCLGHQWHLCQALIGKIQVPTPALILSFDSLCSPFGLPTAVFLRFASILS
jgi:hypothetical protein